MALKEERSDNPLIIEPLLANIRTSHFVVFLAIGGEGNTKVDLAAK